MGAASACMCSSPSPGASDAPSTGIPRGPADRVSPQCLAKAGDIYRLERARWGPGRCLQQDHVSGASAGLLLSLSLFPGRRNRSQPLFCELLRGPLSPASPGDE